jgi:hypothetical protein
VTLEELEVLVVAQQQAIASLDARVTAFEAAAQQLSEAVDQNRREVNLAVAQTVAASGQVAQATARIELVDERLRDEITKVRR